MATRARKSSDPNVAAFNVLQAFTGGDKPKPEEKSKNPAAVALGRLGGLKGGKARAASLTKKQRVAIATKAAKKRWSESEK